MQDQLSSFFGKFTVNTRQLPQMVMMIIMMTTMIKMLPNLPPFSEKGYNILFVCSLLLNNLENKKF